MDKHKKATNLDETRRGSGRHKNALAPIINMFAMTSTTLCSRVAAPAKLNKRAERKTVARAAMTTADAASRRETLGLMAVRFRISDCENRVASAYSGRSRWLD